MGDMATMLLAMMGRLLGLPLRNIIKVLPSHRPTGRRFLRDGLLSSTGTPSDGLTRTKRLEQPSGSSLLSNPPSTPPLINPLFRQGGPITLTSDTRNGSTSTKKPD